QARNGPPPELYFCTTCGQDEFESLTDAENCCNPFITCCEHTDDDGGTYCEEQIELTDLRDPPYCPTHMALRETVWDHDRSMCVLRLRDTVDA
ncbi:MAG: hypothetical protein OXG44_12630, partial [Gammaproteobacteria bacterium]|nr:hypothetical protein [Gammaproteobacteria bacterium]